MKLVITGYSNPGQLVMAQRFCTQFPGHRLVHADRVDPGVSFTAVAGVVAQVFDDPDEWVVVGSMATRAIRYWLEQHPDEQFPAEVVWIGKPPGEELTSFDKGIGTVWDEVLPRLRFHAPAYLELKGMPTA